MTDESMLRAPYPGLRSFRREETDLFFGREDSINVMVDRLAATRFLAVLGSSGTGKSSLVKTGLLDALELGLMAKAGSRWKIVEFRPGGAPLKNLARELLRTQHPGEEPADKDVDLLRAYFARGPRSVIEWCRAGHLVPGTNLLLLVDQFEELFRYQDYAGREEAEAFAAMLLESAHQTELPIYVTITMRSEYLGACALIEGLSDAINAGMYLTPRMSRDQCREAIVGPAAVCDIEIEPALVNRLLNDLATFAPWDERDSNDQLDRIMRRADQLPLLQYTLNRMWLRARERDSAGKIRLTVEDYVAIGGLSGALNAHADQIFADLGKAREPVIEWIFRALTAGSTVADAVRRPTRFDELVAACGGDEAAVRAVVDAFRAPGVNFLVPEYDPRHPKIPADTYIDISHESLIRQWKRLSEWLEAEARAAQQWRRLIDRYNTGEMLRGRELANLVAWRTETKPNASWAKRYGGDYVPVITYLDKSQRAASRKRILSVATAATIFGLMALTTLVAVQQRHEANTQRVEAQLHLAASQQANARIEQMRSDAAANLKLTEDVFENLVFNIVRPIVSERRNTQTSQSTGSESDVRLSVATSALENIRNITVAYPGNNNMRRLLTVMLNMYGDAKLGLNDIDAAAKAYDESLSTVRDLLRTDPDKTLWQDDLALALSRVGQVLTRRNQHADARKAYEEAIAIDRRLVAADPVERLLNNLQVHLGQYGDVLVRLDDHRSALNVFTERLEIRRKLLAFAPDNTQRLEDVSVALDRVGQLIREDGRLEESRQYFTDALKIDRDLFNRDPNRRDWQENLVFSLSRIGDLERQLDNLAQALVVYDEALDLQNKLVARDPKGLGPQRSLASLLNKIGDARRRMKQFEEALRLHQQELDIRRALLKLEPNNIEAHRSVASALDALGNTMRESGDLDGARRAFDEQLQFDRSLFKNDPENPQRMLDLAWSVTRLGDLDRQVGQLAAALKLYEEALALRVKLAALDSGSAARKRSLASQLDKVGDVKRRLKDFAGAIRAHSQEVDIRRELLAETPNDVPATRDLASALDHLGNTRRESGDLDGARKAFLEQLEIDRRLTARDPENSARLLDVVWSLNRVGDLDRQMREWARADEIYAEVLAIQRKLVAREPDNVGRLRALATVLGRIGETRTQLKDLAGALAAYRDQLDVRRQLVARQPGDLEARRDLALTFDYIGNTLRDMDNLDGARRAFEDELEIDRGIYAGDRDDMRRMLDVSWTLNKLGDFLRRLKDYPASLKIFREMMGVETRMLEREPASKARHRKVLDGLTKIAGVLMDMGDFSAAKQAYGELAQADERWVALARQLYSKTANEETRSDLVQAHGDAGWHALLNGRAQVSAQHSEAALKLDGSKTWIRVNLGHAYLFLGRIEEARALYLAVRNINRNDDGKRKYADEIKDDYTLFRRLGIGIAAMDRMEKEIGI